eukprot:scaffold5049_cov112-Isochrysis_galbana.AAC.2
MVQPAVRRELQRPLDPLEALAADGAEGAPAELAARPLRHVGGLIQLAPELERSRSHTLYCPLQSAAQLAALRLSVATHHRDGTLRVGNRGGSHACVHAICTAAHPIGIAVRSAAGPATTRRRCGCRRPAELVRLHIIDRLTLPLRLVGRQTVSLPRPDCGRQRHQRSRVWCQPDLVRTATNRATAARAAAAFTAEPAVVCLPAAGLASTALGVRTACRHPGLGPCHPFPGGAENSVAMQPGEHLRLRSHLDGPALAPSLTPALVPALARPYEPGCDDAKGGIDVGTGEGGWPRDARAGAARGHELEGDLGQVGQHLARRSRLTPVPEASDAACGALAVRLALSRPRPRPRARAPAGTCERFVSVSRESRITKFGSSIQSSIAAAYFSALICASCGKARGGGREA